ncbi:MAG: hypothetical protein RR851_13055 [Clostridium sp.]
MTKEDRAYNLLVAWENNPTNCENTDCYPHCPFLEYCDEAREIVRGDSRWQKLSG